MLDSSGSQKAKPTSILHSELKEIVKDQAVCDQVVVFDGFRCSSRLFSAMIPSPPKLRVVLSIKAGRISASTILRRLGTYSRKNRLYQARNGSGGWAAEIEFLPVSDARHQLDAKQMGKREDGLRLPLGVGVERVRLDVALVLEQPIQDIDGLPDAARDERTEKKAM